VHQARGHQRALLARVHAHRLAVFQEKERRQRAARLDASGGYQLRRFEDVHRRKVAVLALALVDVGQRRIGGAEVDADLHVVAPRLVRRNASSTPSDSAPENRRLKNERKARTMRFTVAPEFQDN
jgi:hypothetical protein